MRDSRKVVAVIGCGRISENAHFPALSKMDDVIIKYACDLIEEKAKDKLRYGVENAVTDYKTVINDPEVDIVYVLTPNYSHYSITMDALCAGKHVFCEKPITVSYPLAKKMAAMARRSKKMLNIGVCNRYNKSVTEIKELIDSGRLGNVYTIYCSFRAHRSIPGLGGAFTTKAESGGGVLIDWGVHFLDLILYILGGAKVRSVSANTYAEMAKSISEYKYRDMWAGPPIPDGTNDVEDYVTGYIRTDKGSISFNGAWAENIERKGLMFVEFMGDKAGVHLDYGSRYTLYTDDLGIEESDGDIPDHYAAEDRDFIDSCMSGIKTRSHIDNILESQKLLDAIYRSASKNREIRF